jgi:hypothetical protein
LAQWLRTALKSVNKDTQPVSKSGKPSELETVPERRAYISARREAERERDAARYRLGEKLARGARVSIPEDKGFLLVPPDGGGFELAQGVVAAANELIDGIGHEGLMARETKGGFLVQEFLPPEAKQLDSPYMRFALSEEVLGPVSAYLGFLPVLAHFDVWYSAHGPEAPKSSQRWHLDRADTTQVKVWIHCSDVGPDSGPLTVVDAATSDVLVDRIGYDFGKGHRVPDDELEDLAGTPAMTALEGPAGTVHFVDTSRCFHMGSRVAEHGTPRRIFVAQYLTPYAFTFKVDFRQKAPFRDLAGSDELERLALGAA